jgi:hypothetical protein
MSKPDQQTTHTPSTVMVVNMEMSGITSGVVWLVSTATSATAIQLRAWNALWNTLLGADGAVPAASRAGAQTERGEARQ